jgi:hypothetical protein
MMWPSVCWTYYSTRFSACMRFYHFVNRHSLLTKLSNRCVHANIILPALTPRNLTSLQPVKSNALQKSRALISCCHIRKTPPAVHVIVCRFHKPPERVHAKKKVLDFLYTIHVLMLTIEVWQFCENFVRFLWEFCDYKKKQKECDAERINLK